MKFKDFKSIRDVALAVDKVFYAFSMKSRTEYIMNKDWDNLIILDACRYDMFKQNNIIPGTLTHLYSKGSSTGHFLVENFRNKSYLDTVYVSSNPLVNYYVESSFFKIIPVWKDGWNEHYKTILPDTMARFGLEAHKAFPHKRLIIHFMQPHFPFIDEEVRNIIGEHEGVMSRNIFLGGKTKHTQTVWKMFRNGQLNRETVWNAYISNLKIALQVLQTLLARLPGKTVISADHGNLFGEWIYPLPLKEYGHLGGLYKKSLIKVPWLVIESENRRKIIKGDKAQISSEDFDLEETKKKLSSLGYL